MTGKPSPTVIIEMSPTLPFVRHQNEHCGTHPRLIFSVDPGI